MLAVPVADVTDGEGRSLHAHERLARRPRVRHLELEALPLGAPRLVHVEPRLPHRREVRPPGGGLRSGQGKGPSAPPPAPESKT